MRFSLYLFVLSDDDALRHFYNPFPYCRSKIGILFSSESFSAPLEDGQGAIFVANDHIPLKIYSKKMRGYWPCDVWLWAEVKVAGGEGYQSRQDLEVVTLSIIQIRRQLDQIRMPDILSMSYLKELSLVFIAKYLFRSLKKENFPGWKMSLAKLTNSKKEEK